MYKNLKRNLTHWLAIMAIAMAALAPSISQAIAVSENGKGLSMEICTTSGQKMVMKVGGASETQQEAKSEHCPYCTLHISATISTQTNLTFEQTGKNLYPQLFYQSPQPLFAWVSLPSRAPPQLA